MRTRHATTPIAQRPPRQSRANENRPHRAPRLRRPLRWSDLSVLITVAPTLAILTIVASYYFGIR